MPTVPHTPEADVERRFRPERDPLPKTFVEMALELGVEPRRESTRLQDAIDVDALSELFRAPDPVKSDVLVAFSIWGIRYVVTPTSVTATRED